jgi:hypothetical protein
MNMNTVGKSALVGLALGAAACAAQATEDYKGEPLLQLTGQATVNTLTGGLPIQPALCFSDNLPTTEYDVVEREELPPQVADLATFDQFWPPYRQTVVDLESEGRFPAEFKVSLYLPPPASVIQSYFAGEPRMGIARFCAVRVDHPDVVDEPLRVVQSCEPEAGERCHKRIVWATRDSQRYYTEDYDCPQRESRAEECVLHTEGDVQLSRESVEYIVGTDSKHVVYLAEAAPPGSFTAWRFGASDGLAPGYHLFANTSLIAQAKAQTDCRLAAVSRASSEAAETFRDHLVRSEVGLTVIEPEMADAYNQEMHRLEALYSMQSCDMPQIVEYSPAEPLMIAINRDVTRVGLDFYAPSAP